MKDDDFNWVHHSIMMVNSRFQLKSCWELIERFSIRYEDRMMESELTEHLLQKQQELKKKNIDYPL